MVGSKSPIGFVLVIAMSFATFHWYVYGTLMTAESARLSPRVCRQLPMSFLGRVFLTWFNPGSGTGYVFAVSNLFMLVLCILAAVAIQAVTGQPNVRTWGGSSAEFVLRYCLLLTGYVVAYLGLGRLLILMIPRREQYGFLLPFLVHVLLALAGAAVPFLPRSWRQRLYDVDYSPLQTTNWIWTLGRGVDNNSFDPVVELLVYMSAAGIFLFNLLLTAGKSKP